MGGGGGGGDGSKIGHFRLASVVRMGSSCHRHTTELLCCRRSACLIQSSGAV